MTWLNLETPVFGVLFVTAFLAVAVWESYHPRRELSTPAERRWGRHGLLLLISAIVQGLVIRATPVAVAVLAEGNRFGLLNKPEIPFAVRCAIALLLLDLANYAAHRAYHTFPWLWRVHEVHHSDPDYDVSTSARFHPLEVVLTRGFTLAVVAVLAAPVAAVFAAEMLAAVVNLFAHANASIPPRLDRWLRMVFITPNMHRIHHSMEVAEQSANLGQALCWWDRLFGTYLTNAAAGEHALATGLKGTDKDTALRMAHLLGAPFQTRRKGEDSVTGGL